MAVSDSIRTCRQCGCRFQRKSKGEHIAYCSEPCFQRSNYERDKRARENSAERCRVDGCCGTIKGRGLCAKHYARLMRHGSPTPAKECDQCGVTFYLVAGGHGPKQYCSEKCAASAKRASAVLSSAKRRLVYATGDKIDPLDIFERDGWRCQICGRDTPESHRGTSIDDAPELDHLFPVTRGGPHKEWNVQCACRKCNNRKRAKSMFEVRCLEVMKDAAPAPAGC